MVWSTAYDAVVRFPADKLDGITGTASATVVGFPEERDYGWRVNIRVPLESGFSVKVTLYIYDNSAVELRPGSHITFTARFSSADKIFGEETESYRSKGIFLTAQVVGSISVDAVSGQFWFFPDYLGEAIREKIKAIFPDDTENFIRALLLGDRTLSDEEPVLATNMKEAGIYHVAAVSGMHVVFLAGLVTALFGKSGGGHCVPR
jgi:competence protein ComEC